MSVQMLWLGGIPIKVETGDLFKVILAHCSSLTMSLADQSDVGI